MEIRKTKLSCMPRTHDQARSEKRSERWNAFLGLPQISKMQRRTKRIEQVLATHFNLISCGLYFICKQSFTGTASGYAIADDFLGAMKKTMVFFW